MWRQKPEPRDSDEILSDDEDELDRVTYNNDFTTKLQSLISNEKKVQPTLPVSSRLESLTDKGKNPIFGAYEVNLRQRNSSSPTGNLKNFSSDYVIGMNGVQDEGNELIQSLSNDEHHSESCDDSISDEENAVLQKLSVTSGAAAVHISSHNLESENQHGPCSWSAVIEEARTLATVSKKTDSCPLGSKTSEAREVHKGNRGRARPKFSFRPLSHRDNLFRSTALMDGNGKPYEDTTKDPAFHNKLVNGTMESSMAELFGNLQEESNELLMKVVPHDQRDGVPSMAELLEDLQEKDGSSTGPLDLLLHNVEEKERKTQYSRKRILPHLGSRILDDEDPPEFSGGGTSSEDEDNDQNHLCVATQKVKGHTMSELFQEAFSISAEPEGPPFPTNKQSGIGYYGRLQQVLQIEKDRHVEFLKRSQIRSPSNDSGSIVDVKILSRFLEAKLTVCQCLFCEYTNSFQSVKGTDKLTDDVETRKRTIIFNSKICNNVELEVGNFVRIHPPWKEVQVKEDEKIILCMYFSPLTAGSSGNS